MRKVILLAILVLAAAGLWWVLRPRPVPQAPTGPFARADAYYRNEQSAEYRRARIELETLAEACDRSAAFHLDMALIDLQEVNYRVQDQDRALSEPDYRRLFRSALQHLDRAQLLEPGNDAVAYNRARVLIKLAPDSENGVDLLAQAALLLEPLTRREPPDPSALLLYGDLLSEQRDLEGARAAYARIEAMGKDFVPRTLYFVALNKLARVLTMLDPPAGAALRDRIEREYPERPKSTPGALERGRYTDLVEPQAPPPTHAEPETLTWERVTDRVGLPALGKPRYVIAPDLDGDCARDLVANGAGGLRVLRNRRNATFDDLTKAAGLPEDMVIAAAAAGDVDNDGRCDLVLGGPGGLRLFLNRTPAEAPGDWRFAESRLDGGASSFDARAGEPVACLAFWDLDHDGDLDLFVGGATNRVYLAAIEYAPRKEGEDPSIPPVRFVRYTECGEKLGLGAPAAADALILDVEDDQDVDLLVTSAAGNAWFENRRELRFTKHDLPQGEGLEARDVDNDLLEEVRIGTTVWKWKDGAFAKVAEHFALTDLDGDGVVDTKPQPGLASEGRPIRAIDSDFNRDGSCDLLALTDTRLDLFLSVRAAACGWIDVRPRGLKTNELGIGTSVRLRAGDLRIGATCRDGLVSFGLGRRSMVDAIFLRWTNGVEQGSVTPRVASCTEIEEREGEVGSCPFVYAFDGERWHFVADCQSGTPLGLPVATGVYLPARSNETILVPGETLKAVNGVIRLDLAEEFRELFYVDQVVLRAIDHPKDVRPVLNEGFRVMSFPEFRVHALDDLRPPVAARDQAGKDILDLVRSRDGRHWKGFEPLDGQYTGLAREWAITLDFGDVIRGGSGGDPARVLLVMDGWVEFPTCSASIAASQSKTVHFMPPVIEVPQADGTWKVAEGDPGFPAGKGKAVLVDLTGKLGVDGRIRIRSTQRIHWDAFSISTGPDRDRKITPLRLIGAVHKYRGIGRRVDDPDGEQPWRYSHDDLLAFVPYDQMPTGMVTKYGEVREFVADIDDRYPIMASGDVIELSFDSTELPILPQGWVRDFCFTTEGWVKDADMNQAVRETVRPLPFHGMSGYPYDETKEHHPQPDFLAEWLTRPTRRLVDPEALK
ncbi:MAG TPA: VCBS repeat-containing protein [Planctomycetota bacterium]|nr:VCBS repeat-containing protein [Planctomycetota bacterium]